jgi:hypothetical protein
MRTIKDFVRQALDGNVGAQAVVSDNDELNELAVIVPKELDRVQSRKAKLESELKSMQSLLNIVGSDMIAGIQTEKVTGDKKIGDKVWCMMTEFKINVE